MRIQLEQRNKAYEDVKRKMEILQSNLSDAPGEEHGGITSPISADCVTQADLDIISPVTNESTLQESEPTLGVVNEEGVAMDKSVCSSHDAAHYLVSFAAGCPKICGPKDSNFFIHGLANYEIITSKKAPILIMMVFVWL